MKMIKSQLSYGNLAIDSHTAKIIKIRKIGTSLNEDDSVIDDGNGNTIINFNQIVPLPVSGKILKEFGFEFYKKLKEEAYIARHFNGDHRWIIYVTVTGNAGYTIRIVQLKESETITVSTIEVENLSFHVLQNICNNLVPNFELNANVDDLNRRYLGRIPKYNSYKFKEDEED